MTGVGFPLIRAVLLQDLSTGMVQNFAYGAFKGKETGEMALARQLLPGLKSGDLAHWETATFRLIFC